MSVVTKTQLENATLDCATLESVVNDDATPGTVTSRLGTPLKSLAKIILDLSEQDIGAGAAALINARLDGIVSGYDSQIASLSDRIAVLEGGSSGMPAGAIGLWYASDYSVTPRPYIRNRMAASTVPKNLLNGSKRMFNESEWYNKHNLTIVDGVADEDSALNASTITSTNSDWYLARSLTSLPAGTYTCAVSAKRNTGSDQVFKFFIVDCPNFTATSTWQRFNYTFTHAGGAVGFGFITTGSGTDIVVSDFELYAGSSDLGPELPSVGHLFLDKDAASVNHSHSGSVLSLDAAGSFGFIQFPTAISTDNISVVALVRKVGTSSGYVNSISDIHNANKFSARIELAGIPGFAIGSEFSGQMIQRNNGWDLTDRGWFTFAHVVEDSVRAIWFDQAKMDTSTTTVTSATIQDLIVSGLQSVYGRGYEFAGLAMWDRTLTDEETLLAQQVMIEATGVTRGQVRFLIVGGDSLTGGDTGYPAVFLSHDSPSVLFAIYSLNGGTLADVAPRMASKIPATRVTGSKYIVSLMVTNGLSDVSAYLTLLQGVCDDFIADGAIMVLGTLPPRAETGPNIGFNAKRNAVNTEIRTWVGTHCHAIFDLAADATVGTDAAGEDTSLYFDGVHPTATVESTYFEPIYRAAINAL
jgi:lysophospholipase L1-like esterase